MTELRDTVPTVRRLRTPTDRPPVYSYQPIPGVPSVTVMRFDGTQIPPGALASDHAHSHDFLVLAFFEQGGGSITLAGRHWHIQAGDVYVIAPGEVVGAGADVDGMHTAVAWTVFFPPEVLGPQAPGAFLSWRSHPLLYPFIGAGAGGAQRLNVPHDQRSAWSRRLALLDDELRQRRDGYREAVLAHLTLLLVDVSRLAADVVGDLRLADEPLLAAVFEHIEHGYREPISLKDIAAATRLTPGHLTTVVRRKTGRTVGEWITERRMAEARLLLVQTNAAVHEVARRTGYNDPAYFVRTFRRMHGTTPLRWRRAAGRT
jgi:AraC-like DNA-binding protein/quercetin dioxygenase-like cupin family protein